MKRSLSLLSFILLLLIPAVMLLIAQVPETVSTLPKPDESPLFIERYAELQPNERIAIQVYERRNKSVVNIDTRTTYNALFGQQVDDPGAGSGIVLDKEGHILTNYHVVARIDAAKVTLFNGESYDAQPVGIDPVTDLAVIRIKAPRDVLFPMMPDDFGDSSKLLVGQQIFAIGNPFGLERTLTGGLISSLNRAIPSHVQGRSIKGLIQIDAAINPGNSGGALLDSQGKLIGINTAIASKSGGSHGVGFAIPSKIILRIVPQLIRNGKVIRGETGIDAVMEISNDAKVQGLMIKALAEGGPAEKAGLRGPKIVRVRRVLGNIEFIQPQRDDSVADIITAVDGIPVKRAEDFTEIVDERTPGNRIVLDVFREGKMIKVPVILE